MPGLWRCRGLSSPLPDPKKGGSDPRRYMPQLSTVLDGRAPFHLLVRPPCPTLMRIVLNLTFFFFSHLYSIDITQKSVGFDYAVFFLLPVQASWSFDDRLSVTNLFE